MNVIIVPKNISSGVFDSQVFPLLIHSGASALFFRTQSQAGLLMKEKRESDFQIIIGWLSLLKHLFVVSNFYTRDVFDFTKIFILRSFNLFRPNQHHDFRALISEVSYMRHSSLSRKVILSTFEAFAFICSRNVSCVSNNLKRELHKRFYQKKIDVIPCCISIEEVLVTKYPMDKDKNSFVYIGSISAWQMFEESLCFYSKLNLEGKSLTVFTRDVEEAENLLSKHSIDAEVISADREVVFEKLKRFSFGFVMRNDSLVNRTASPIKFMEYAANGVIPITTSHVGDYSNFFSDNILNIDFYGEGEQIDEVLDSLLSPENQSELVNKAKKFTWQNYKHYLFG